jgi:hypothetical protein
MIEIKGKQYRLRYTLRALVVYEELKAGKFSKGQLMDEVILYYSIFIASNPGADVTFEEFFNEIENLDVLASLRKWMSEKVDTILPNIESVADEDAKKKEQPQGTYIKN